MVAVLGALLLCHAAPGVASAQTESGEASEATTAPAKEPPASTGKGMPALDTDCRGAEDFGGSDLERAAYCELMMGRYVSARTLADKALVQNPDSFRAHFAMGYAQHLGEANLPKALYHLERAEQLFVARYGRIPDKDRSPWRPYLRVLLELVYVHGEMDHHEAKIEYVDALRERLNVDYQARKSWPLLKLKRFEEARLVAERALKSEDEWDQAVGYTALCAVESEMRNRKAAYEACKAAAQRVLRRTADGAVELSNAAAAAEEVFELDEAERLYLEATRRNPEGSVNPWGRLVRLYLRQGRLSEALSAWRQMRAYRARRGGAHMDQQDQSEAELVGASVLLVAGRPEDAEPITRRTVNRPDRQGTSSAASDQNEAGAAVMDRVAKLTLARALEEEAAIAPLGESLELHWRALRLRFEAWQVGRRAVEVLADPERLMSTLRPECPGSIEMPNWLDAEVIDLVGPGVAQAALQRARADETLPEDLAGPVFDAFVAEALWLDGDTAEAEAKARSVVERLPPSEALGRARAAAVAAAAAWAEGDHAVVLQMLRVVLAQDPALIRRMGLQLPVRFAASGEGAATEAVELLSGSPLFEEVDWGFTLAVSEAQARLTTDDGTVITEMFVPARGEKETVPEPRRIARAVHQRLLAPDLDITQADVRSLDGSLGTGGKASDRVRSILDEVKEEE